MSQRKRGKNEKSAKSDKTSKPNRRPNQVRVFVATPGDVSKERDIVRELLEDFDLMFEGLAAINIRFVGWETVVPSLGRAQELINKNLRRADIFVGIMWNRFGSATGKFESGTEDEFNIAFDLWKARGVPWVIFYFSDMPSVLNSAEETDQRKKVLEFKKMVQQQGLTDSYSDINEFRRKVLRHLGHVIMRILHYQNQVNNAMNKKPIRVFISSTFLDVRAEREAAINIIEEINHTVGDALNFHLDAFRWEAVNQIETPAAIFDSIVKTDLFIGILGSRLGTFAKTKDYGVINEFDYALNQWSKTGKPHLLFYFRETPEVLRTLEEIEHKHNVLEFKSRVKQLALVKSFSDVASFSNMLREDLTNVVMQQLKSSEETPDAANLKETVFVGMSLAGAEFHRIFEGLVVRALRRAAPNYKAVSAKDLYATSESLTSQLTTLLTETPLAIFDVSDLNPNVMIEIGIRSRLAPFIILTRNLDSLPFFLKTYHCLVYEPTVAGINNAIPELSDLIRRTLAPKSKVVAKTDYQNYELAV